MLDLIVSAFITLFVITDPIGNGPVFATLTKGSDAPHVRRMARNGVIAAGVIITVFSLIGPKLLDSIGIGMPAMQVAGGILLLLLGIDMVLARPSGLRSPTDPEHVESMARRDISIFPIAIPLVAGPGAMVSMLLLLEKGQGFLEDLIVYLVMGVVLIISWVVFRLAGHVTRFLGETGVNAIDRIMGVLLCSLACQFVINGVDGAIDAIIQSPAKLV